MSGPTIVLAAPEVIAAAKALQSAYNEKNWKAVRERITPDFLYDEVATHREVQGAELAVGLWQGWARAFPDSRASFDHAVASGDTVVLEVTWRGTHTGRLETPIGTVPPTGRTIQIRACIVVGMAGDRARWERHYFDMTTLLDQLGITG
jgi:steroid delta-isomerase-like uncharacterized protein